MTKEEQRKFIRAHTRYLRDQMLKKIDTNQVPNSWNELELRWSLFDNFAPEITNLSDKEAARRNKYNYYVITHNL